MKNTEEVKILKKTSDEISSSIKDEQEKNRLWWETLPMTYEDWESKDRIPTTKADFEGIEKKFLEGNPWLKEKFRFDTFLSKKVLEIGCGSGVASCLFAKGGALVTAVDITENAVKIATQNASVNGLTTIKVERQDAEALSFENGSFDYVFSWGVLHHSKDTVKAFKEVYRTLSIGGKGLIMVYNKNSFRYYLKGLYWLLAKGKIFQGYTLATVQDCYCDGFYHRHFTPKELEEILSSIGFKVKIDITHMGGKVFPFLPKNVEEWIKEKYGWLLIALIEKAS